MNEYKITYGTPNSETGSAHITERSEAAARKAFKASYKNIGYSVPDILDIELIRDDALATKEQERETLATIRQMVEELGPQSYLATAFEGAFEDAEVNIENDFGDSMKRRYESSEAALKKQIETGYRLEESVHCLEISVEQLKAENERLRQQTVSDSDLAHLLRLAEKDLTEAEQRRDEAAADIVKYADDPASEQFRQAVTDHRNATASVEAKRERLERLNSIRSAS